MTVTAVRLGIAELTATRSVDGVREDNPNARKTVRFPLNLRRFVIFVRPLAKRRRPRILFLTHILNIKHVYLLDFFSNINKRIGRE